MNEQNGLAPGFGKRIKNRRKELKMTQRKLAEKSGIAFRSIQDYESEKRNPKVEARRAIADALGCGLTDLFNEEPSFSFSTEEEERRYIDHGDGTQTIERRLPDGTIVNESPLISESVDLSQCTYEELQRLGYPKIEDAFDLKIYTVEERKELLNFGDYLLFKRKNPPK